MCTRINNVDVLMSLVPKFEHQVAAAVDLDYMLDLTQEISEEDTNVNQMEGEL